MFRRPSWYTRSIDAAEHPIQLDKQDSNASSSDKAQKEHITRDGIIRDLYVAM